MNIKAWIAVGVAGFAIGAGANGMQTALSNGDTASPSSLQSGTGNEDQSPTRFDDGEFDIPQDGEVGLPEGPFTLPDGTIVDLSEDGGTITLPDGTIVDAPVFRERPGGGGGRFGGQQTP